MDRAAAAAYVYAKSSGMLAKSYAAERSARLFQAKSLKDLYTLLFSDEIPAVPENLLAKEIEIKAEQQFIDDYIGLLSAYDKPEFLHLQLLHTFDYENLKMLGAALPSERQSLPKIADTHQFALFNYAAWPEISKVTAESDVSWYNKFPEVTEQHDFDLRLDNQYVKDLWAGVKRLSGDDFKVAKSLIGKEIIYNNIIWVLRLKVYYRMNSEEIKNQLVCEKSFDKDDYFAGPAFRILENDASSYDDWKSWKYSDMLNPHEEGVVWEIDPSWVEKLMRQDVILHARRAFHTNPLSPVALVAWFKLKQNELDSIRTAAEGLRLSLDSGELLEAALFPASENKNTGRK